MDFQVSSLSAFVFFGGCRADAGRTSTRVFADASAYFFLASFARFWAVAAVAGAASTAATSFVVGDGRTPLPPGPPTPQHLIPGQAPVAAAPARSPQAPFAAAPLPASLSIPYPAALSLAPTQTGRPRAPSGGAASYFAPAAC